MDRALTAILGFVAAAAAVAVLAVAAVVLTTNAEDSDRPEAIFAIEPAVIEGVSFPAIDHDPGAAEGLLEAWERWRTSSFVSIGTWTRTVDDVAGELSGEVYTAQDPLRRLTVRLGAVTEQFDALTAACSPEEDEDSVTPPCLAGEGIGYDERVAREMVLVEQYVSGTTRIYDVATDGDCFQAELIGPALASPWGRWAEFCFDDESGALELARIRRPSAIDVESIHTIRTDVTDADFG